MDIKGKIEKLKNRFNTLLSARYGTEEEACDAYEHAYYLYMMDITDYKPDPADLGVAHRFGVRKWNK